jgi:hypothetical protein
MLHSPEHVNGSTFKGQLVLVVRFGNSGNEISVDPHEHGAKPGSAVCNQVNVIPRELAGRCHKRADSAMDGDLARYGLRTLPYGPATQIRQDRRFSLIDMGTLQLIWERHITICLDVAEVSGNRISSAFLRLLRLSTGMFREIAREAEQIGAATGAMAATRAYQMCDD